MKGKTKARKNVPFKVMPWETTKDRFSDEGRKGGMKFNDERLRRDIRQILTGKDATAE